jgi:CRP-like cAMP-binding protein
LFDIGPTSGRDPAKQEPSRQQARLEKRESARRSQAQEKPMARLSGGLDTTNRLLLALPEAVSERIRPELEVVDLVRGEIIFHVDSPINHLYFVDRGLISLVKTMQDGRTVEIGAVGLEGVTGSEALFGITSAMLESIVQIPGTAFRIASGVMRKEMARSEPLRALVQNYAHFAVGHLAQTAACNRLHSLEERCCRWLLIAHDSARSDTFPLTHEFLAMMLGVQRTGVSLTANILQRAGLIRYTRGIVTITDRQALEATACECYTAIHAQLDRLFEAPKQSSSP